IGGINKAPGRIDGVWVLSEIIITLIFIVAAGAIKEEFTLYMCRPYWKLSSCPPRNVTIGISIHYVEARSGEFRNSITCFAKGGCAIQLISSLNGIVFHLKQQPGKCYRVSSFFHIFNNPINDGAVPTGLHQKVDVFLTMNFNYFSSGFKFFPAFLKFYKC